MNFYPVRNKKNRRESAIVSSQLLPGLRVRLSPIEPLWSFKRYYDYILNNFQPEVRIIATMCARVILFRSYL